MNNQPKKSLGQHWLYDESIIKSIIDQAKLTDNDTVLEIGPGLGTMTKQLVAEAGEVLAVEYDEQLASELPQRVVAENLQVQQADVLDFDFTALPAGYKVVANIPYYLTSHLIRRLLESNNKPAIIVLLIQQEVAERIVAAPGQMSLLSISAQHYALVRLGPFVAAEHFEPPPKVDSQVVILTPKERPHMIDQRQFFKLVKAGFGEKRKKLRNSISGGLGVEKELVASTLEELQLNPNVRAQELSLEQWYKLYEHLEHA